MTDTGWVVTFGGSALLVLALLQGIRVYRDHAPLSKGFTRTFGIVFVASLAVFLVVTDATAEELTAAFTVLGTLAGYIVGAQPDAATKKTTTGDDNKTIVTETE